MKKINQKVYEVILLFIFSLTPVLWLSPGQLILGHDSGFRLNPVDHLHNLFYSWSSISNFGVDWSFFKGFLITQFPETVFTVVTHSLWLGQELTFIFGFFLMGIAMYICLNSLFSKKEHWFLRIFSSTFYMYNFFILQAWFIAERGKFSLYAALPLGFIILYNTIEKKYSLLKGTLLFSLLFFFLNGGGNPPLYGGLLVTYCTLGLVELFRKFQNKETRVYEIFRMVKIVGVFLVALIIVNAYWIFPQVYLTTHSYTSRLSSVGGIEGLLGWEKIISKNASITNLLRLQGVPDWYDNPLHPYANWYLTNPLLIAASILPFLIILIGFYIQKKFKKETEEKQIINIILAIFFAGILFSGGTHPPLGFVYEWFMKYIPGFAIFRSSYYKFSPALFFPTVFLTGYFLNTLLLRKNACYSFFKVKQESFYLFSGAIIIFALLLYHFPFFTTNFFIFNKPFTTKVSLPRYVTDSFAYLNKKMNNQDEKILLLPELNSSLNADTYNWGYWSLDLLPRIGLKNPILASDSDANIVSSIYKAIDTNDEAVFMKLVRAVGVNKILWRGDFLYNDHITTSQNFQKEEDNLKKFSHVTLEETNGPWKLYKINSVQTSLFTTGFVENSLKTSDFNYVDVIQLSNVHTNDVWIDSSAANDAKDMLGNGIFVWQDDCTSCNEDSTDMLSQQLKMPSVRFLPWSKIYFLITFKEQRELIASRNNPQARIDVDLSHANKRLAEIWRMAFHDFNAQAPLYVAKNVERYKATIQDALKQIAQIPIKERKAYLVRISAYLQFQKEYISPYSKNTLIKNSIDTITSFIDEQTVLVDKSMWISTSNDDRKSFVSLPQSGSYNITLLNTQQIPYVLSIDGKKLQILNDVNLSSGIHTLEVMYPFVENYLQVETVLINTKLQIRPSQSIDASIRDFSYSKDYAVNFTYTIPLHGKVDFQIVEKYTARDTRRVAFDAGLQSDGNPHTFSYVYTPTQGISSVNLRLISTNTSSVVFSQFSVEEKNNPRIYFSKGGYEDIKQDPKISYKKIDPTKYIVTVHNATKPFLLLFNQSFTSGWRASYMSSNTYHFFDKTTRISENMHVETNGYSNGWNITKKGDFSLLIEYTPQNIFYIGCSVTIAGILIIFIVGMLRIKKKYYEKK